VHRFARNDLGVGALRLEVDVFGCVGYSLQLIIVRLARLAGRLYADKARSFTSFRMTVRCSQAGFISQGQCKGDLKVRVLRWN